MFWSSLSTQYKYEYLTLLNKYDYGTPVYNTQEIEDCGTHR